MNFGSLSRLPSGFAAGPAWIAVGLLLMIVAVVFPDAPIVTAVAIIALGVTEVTIARTPRSASTIPILILHALCYALLYALFAGSRLHQSLEAPTTTLSVFTTLDLALSLLPMAIALKRISSCLRQLFVSHR